MRVIPVLDIRHGQAVRAVAGNRAHYGPLRSILHEGTDPVVLARAGREIWGLPDLYLADLDAILGEAPAALELFRKLADLGLTLWVDPGVKTLSDVPELIDAGAAHVIVGLETLEGPDALRAILDEVGPERAVFSLDLREGRPMVTTGLAWKTESPDEITSIAIDLGVTRIIRLDLARVGTSQGTGVAGVIPDRRASWFAGGGISGIEEIVSLARSGYAGALVGSALHDGRISTKELKQIKI